MVGQTVSHYRILEKLGEGGMGVVYKAEDLKLGRPVALKFLPSHLLESQEHRARFLQEARAAALLDHPNICAVYEIDDVQGRTLLAMACLEGQTLKEKISARPLPLTEALGIATQIGDGLQAAHERGVIHRDIKPANIMITPQGQAKIMDFGLAQLSDRTKLTATGMKLGTPAYMSPQQTEGTPADRRSDMWSLGVVLYEMVSGRLPFAGESEAAVAYGIVHTDPEPLSALRTGVPLELDRIVTKCLAKNPAERYQHAEDLTTDLRTLAKHTAHRPAVAGKPVRPWAWLLAGAAAASLMGSVAILMRPIEEAALPASASLRQIASYTGTESDAAISPDGRNFAFVSDLGGQPDLWVRQVSGAEPIQLTRDAAVEQHLVYAPDGESIYYTSSASIWRIAALGGSAQKVVDGGREPSLSADGSRLAFLRAQDIFVAGADGTGETKVVAARGWQGHASLSPDGRRIAFTEGGLFEMLKLYVVDVLGGTPRLLCDIGFGSTATPAWLPDGQTVVFERSTEHHPNAKASDLWTIAANGGTVRRLTVNPSGRFGSMRISRDGSRLVATVAEVQHEIWTAPLGSDPQANGNAAVRLVDSAHGPLWIHNAGSTLLFSGWLTGTRNLWRMPLDGSGPPRQITSFEDDSITHAVLSPDASRLAFTSLQTGNAEIWTMNVDGSNPVQLTRTESSESWPTWTRDGKWIAYGSEGPGDAQIWRVPSSGGEPVQVTRNGGGRGSWSPVDDRILYTAGLLGKPRLEAADFDGNVLWAIDWPEGWMLPVWSPDGQRFTAIRTESPDNVSVWIFDAVTGQGRLAVRFPGRFHLLFRALWTPDGKSLIVNRAERITHVVLLENFWN